MPGPRYKGSKRYKNIVMKSKHDREQMPSCDWVVHNKHDFILENNISDCCGAELIRIAGSLRCLECDKYCKVKSK